MPNDSSQVISGGGMQRLTAASTAIVVVDVQEKLSQVMPEERMRDVERASRILLEAARLLGLRTVSTEQYPRGLGGTLPEVVQGLERAGGTRLEKTEFSACDAAGFAEALGQGVSTVVVVGMEAHVCVFQTVRDLVAAGFSVHVPSDGVVSRRDDHRAIGLELCARAGAVVTTAETVAFDLLGRSGTHEFKALSKLIR